MNMNHRHLVAAGAKITVDGKEVPLPDRPVGGYPENYPAQIEISSLRSYKGENLEEFKSKELASPVKIE